MGMDKQLKVSGKIFLILTFCIVFYPSHVDAQCNWQDRPEKWLYNVGFYGFTKTEPETIKYATERTWFFDAFVYRGMYSIVRDTKGICFYIFFEGKTKYPCSIELKDSIGFYFKQQKEIKLAPLVQYDNKLNRMMAFYRLDSLTLDIMSSVDLDSIVFRFTPQLTEKQRKNETDLFQKFTFKNLSDKHIRLFKENATCFKNRFARKVKPKP
jgi:hypothetical protein